MTELILISINIIYRNLLYHDPNLFLIRLELREPDRFQKATVPPIF